MLTIVRKLERVSPLLSLPLDEGVFVGFNEGLDGLLLSDPDGCAGGTSDGIAGDV